MLDSCVVAFSGGVDSALLLKAAVLALGDRAIAATGLSETYASEEMEEARSVAAEIGAVHVMVRTMELTDPRYANNSHQRCFFCKTELYTQLQAYAKQHGYAAVVDGTNADDLGDFRPGIRAANQLGVRSPLQDAGLTKQEIRDLSQWLALPTWNKPAAACLVIAFCLWRSDHRRKAVASRRKRKVICADWAIADSGCGTTTRSLVSKCPPSSLPARSLTAT